MKNVGYVDGYVLVVPKNKEEEYRKVADEAAQMWLKHGALSVRECVGDDLTPDMGEFSLRQFPQIMSTSEDEIVWFSYIEYETKDERDRINAEVAKEMAQKHEENPEEMPFDMSKMAFGGFHARVSRG